MSQTITAVFENGVFKPEENVDIPPGTRVQLSLEILTNGTEDTCDREWEEFERFCEEISFDSGGQRWTRDQLHEGRRFDCGGDHEPNDPCGV